MNPRTTDPTASQTLYVLHHRYTDAWDRVVADVDPATLAEFVVWVEGFALATVQEAIPARAAPLPQIGCARAEHTNHHAPPAER